MKKLAVAFEGILGVGRPFHEAAIGTLSQHPSEKTLDFRGDRSMNMPNQEVGAVKTIGQESRQCSRRGSNECSSFFKKQGFQRT